MKQFQNGISQIIFGTYISSGEFSGITITFRIQCEEIKRYLKLIVIYVGRAFRLVKHLFLLCHIFQFELPEITYYILSSRNYPFENDEWRYPTDYG